MDPKMDRAIAKRARPRRNRGSGHGMVQPSRGFRDGCLDFPVAVEIPLTLRRIEDNALRVSSMTIRAPAPPTRAPALAARIVSSGELSQAGPARKLCGWLSSSGVNSAAIGCVPLRSVRTNRPRMYAVPRVGAPCCPGHQGRVLATPAAWPPNAAPPA